MKALVGLELEQTPGNDPEQYDNPNYRLGMLLEEYSKLYPCC